jgi:hypothetical protein
MMSTTTDSAFTMLLGELKSAEMSYRRHMGVKGDTACSTFFELGVVKQSIKNILPILSQRLIKKIDPTYIFPDSSSSGSPLEIIPHVGAQMDRYLGLYSNVSGLLGALDDFREESTWGKAMKDSNTYWLTLEAYLKDVIGNDDVETINPASFSYLVLWYTDYLLYAAMCSYMDNDFFSRYINHYKVLVDEVKVLVDKISPEFNHNNIVIRFYAMAALYDFLLEQDTDNFDTLVTYMDAFIDSTGEYGEGINYFIYTSGIVLPLIYMGLQEQYMYGAKAGEERYRRYSFDMKIYEKYGIYDSLEQAEQVYTWGDAPWRMFLYPYRRTLTSPSSWRPSLNVTRQNGSLIQIPTGTQNDNLCMTMIAEEHPEYGGTHDAIDHGAIQFSRFINDVTGRNPHVDHLLIDPGYPRFSDQKRDELEWQFCNQNVQMLWDSEFTLTTGETSGEHSQPSDEPDSTGNEEILGYEEGKDYHTEERFDYKVNGGMTGYHYVSPWQLRSIVRKYIMRDDGLQNNNWEIVDAMTMQSIKEKTLSALGGEGKSTLITHYINGAEVRIDYKYPKEQEIFLFKEKFNLQTIAYGIGAIFTGDFIEVIGLLVDDIYAKFYYNRNIVYEDSYYGMRGVYTLGNNYFVIDHLPQAGLPSSVSLATSWNMPKNTVAMGDTGWQQYVFEGTTPDSSQQAGGFTPQSRIEIAVAGARAVTSDTTKENAQFEIYDGDSLLTNHITFERTHDDFLYMIAGFRTTNASNTLSAHVSQTKDYSTVTNGIVWTREFADGTKTMVVFNPNQTSQTVDSITSDAKVWLLQSDTAGDWQNARLYGATANPIFSGYSPIPSVIALSGPSGVQYEVVF